MKWIKYILHRIKLAIIGWLLLLRSKLRMQSLREAIQEADKVKAETKCKMIVVFNSTSGKYEPVKKKTLKLAHKQRIIKIQRVKQIEKRSPYVTN